jgi:hypothetical protein
MGTPRNTYIAESRVYENPGDPAESKYDVVYPVTALEAVIDPKTGDNLSQILPKVGGSFPAMTGVIRQASTQIQITSNPINIDDKIFSYNGHYNLKEQSYLYRLPFVSSVENFTIDSSNNRVVAYRAVVSAHVQSTRTATFSIFRRNISDDIPETVLTTQTIVLPAAVPITATNNNARVMIGLNTDNRDELNLIFFNQSAYQTTGPIYGVLYSYSISQNTLNLINQNLFTNIAQFRFAASASFLISAAQIMACTNSRIVVGGSWAQTDQSGQATSSVNVFDKTTGLISDLTTVHTASQHIRNYPMCVDYNENIFSHTVGSGITSANTVRPRAYFIRNIDGTKRIYHLISTPVEDLYITKNYVYGIRDIAAFASNMLYTANIGGIE